MPDTLIIGGQTYTNVAGIKATDSNSVIQTFSKGGGGASNYVTGTFKGTTTGTAIDVNIPYTGSGYPIVVLIYPEEGTYNQSGTFYSTIQRYAINFYVAIKNVLTTTPTYNTTDDSNKYAVSVRYKNSTSVATSYTNNTSNIDTIVCAGSDAGSLVSSITRFKSATEMSVYIKNPNTNYGFLVNTDYRYYIIYSS